MKGKGASLSKSADLLIVAPPRQAKLQAIIFIFDAQAVPNRLKSVGERERVLALVGQVDDRGSENRPIATEEDPAGKTQLLLVAQILDRRVDVAVEAEVADLGIGLVGTESEVDLVAADGEIALVETIAMREVDQPPVTDARSSNDI